MQKHYNSIEWYFENKKDYHRDIVVHVPLNKFRELFDEGDEIPKRLDKSTTIFKRQKTCSASRMNIVSQIHNVGSDV